MRALFALAAIFVLASGVTFALARLATGTAAETILNELHQNLSIGIDLALPTWYASVLWALFAILAALMAGTTRRSRPAWVLMALTAAAASVDEYLMLHERLSRPASGLESRLGIDLGGATWVLIGVPLAAALAGVLFSVVRALPKGARRDVLLGGAFFMVGAVGFEVIQHALFDAADLNNWLVTMVNHLEETFEFVGLIFAIRGLARVLPIQVGPAQVVALPDQSALPSARGQA